jgi:hypothetical protein
LRFRRPLAASPAAQERRPYLCLFPSLTPAPPLSTPSHPTPPGPTPSPRPPSGYDNDTLLKYGCLGANTVTEEAIDVVLHNSYKDKDTVWDGYKIVK